MNKIFLAVLTAALAVAAGPAAGVETNDPMANVPHGDPAMAAAYQKAQATLDVFLTAWRHPPAGATGFAIKVGIVDTATPPGFAIVRPGESRGIVEYFWVGALRETSTGFAGEIHNQPDTVRNLSVGQKIVFARNDIADWTYFQGDRIVGNMTACPALAHASAAERQLMHEKYGLDCP